MILIIYLALSASSCPVTIVENRTSVWNEYDQETLDRATLRCKEIYPDAPCLKKFTKKDELAYAAICGK